ncbi:MAG: hypothetical protein HN790_01925 [Methylococcales bacterium]|jgi:hypothetical protein|nr:hypothetical protein [Methylococcales bacterium]
MSAPDHEQKRAQLSTLLSGFAMIEDQLRRFEALKCEAIQVTAESGNGAVWGWTESHDNMALGYLSDEDLGEKIVNWLLTQSDCEGQGDPVVLELTAAFQGLGYSVEDYAYIRQNSADVIAAFDYAQAALEVMLSVDAALTLYQSFSMSPCEVFPNPDDQQVWGFSDQADAELLGAVGDAGTTIRVLNWLYYSSSQNPKMKGS